MQQNLISLNLSDDDINQIDAALGILEQRLSGLVALTNDERRSLTKMGDKSEAFCRQTLAVLSQNPDLLPPRFSLAEAQRDLAAIDVLRPRLARMRRLMERAEDSDTALGSDVMTAALEGYALLRVSGSGSGLDALRTAIGSRFTRASRPAAPASPSGT